MKSANPKNQRHVYITAPKHVSDELVKLNGVEFKGKFLFIEITKVKPKLANPNKINFISPNRFQPLRFANNSPDCGNDIEHSEESDLVRNTQENSKYISKRRPSVVVNAHPENQTTFSKVSVSSRILEQRPESLKKGTFGIVLPTNTLK